VDCFERSLTQPGLEYAHRCYMTPLVRKRSEDLEDPPSDPNTLDALVEYHETLQAHEVDGGEERRLVELLSSMAEDEAEFKQSAPALKPRTFIFYDFESVQNRQLSPGKNLHEVYYCVARKTCDTCHSAEEKCADCVQHIFEGMDALDSFCRWLFSEENRNTTALAHNGKGTVTFVHICSVHIWSVRTCSAHGCSVHACSHHFSLLGYDAQFVVRWLIQQGLVPKIIAKGMNLIYVQHMDIRLIDSMSFLQGSLDSLAKAYKLTTRKGSFPFLWITPERLHYVGPWPEAKYYQPDFMAPKKRQEFLAWYDTVKDQQFDCAKEVELYTIADVVILEQVFMKFRQNFMDQTGWDPAASITIAGACQSAFRLGFLKPKTIGIVPPNGYVPRVRSSVKATKWLAYVARERGIDIRHSKNGGEKTVRLDGRILRLDGWTDLGDGSVGKAFEFNG
jgi:hypothetical protein